MNTVKLFKQLLLAVAALSTFACGSNQIKDEDFFEPAKLQKIDTTVRAERAWSTRIGNGQGKNYVRLQPYLDGSELYVAAHDGVVAKLDAESGKVSWREKNKYRVTGGVSAYEDKMFLGTIDGQAIALSTSDGSEQWRKQLSAEVLSAPVSDGEVVIVHCFDGFVYGLEHASGEILWEFEASEPRLSLRGSSTPVLIGGLAIIGLANGKIVALDSRNGIRQWEQRVMIAQGRSEIDRIVDIDGTPVVDDEYMYAVSYQGHLVVIQLANARTLWRKEESSSVSLAHGYGNIYVAAHDGKLNAYRINDGSLNWQLEDLEWRNLSGPATVGKYLAVGDYDGYVHIVSQIDGALAGRIRVDGSGIRAPLMSDVANGRLLVYSNDGRLASYRLEDAQP